MAAGVPFGGLTSLVLAGQGETVATYSGGVRQEKRKREAKGAAEDVDAFRGPWARFEEEALFDQEVEEAEGPLNLWSRKDIDVPSAKKARADQESSTLHSMSRTYSLCL